MAASQNQGTHILPPVPAATRLAAAVAAPALAVGLLLSGCQGSDAGTDPESTENGDDDAADADSGDTGDDADDDAAENGAADDTGEAAETELSIEVAVNEDADDLPAGEDEPETGQWSLTCAPEGGDHPDPEAACAELSDIDPGVFEPVSEDQMCTHIYGGPHVATVTGHVEGTEVDATFSRADGCEIDRWDSMGAVLQP
ncbi:SSI family serine proteinase inhibitor [Lipingzhangella sp. LS1_29]|uniref:SSI family serine proteinase inhibitor n=1 Tax=Lipingzhangella rawalii TaxID=2055835 RepID=A0ABU2H8N6_9ACTN|nr:SSI family serine proteinase inhibitor [Lipingzhangella rawalii]MDS1271662.1 SSI family serine proteinase inhibitor [Lipingzhangella rawalii]